MDISLELLFEAIYEAMKIIEKEKSCSENAA